MFPCALAGNVQALRLGWQCPGPAPCALSFLFYYMSCALRPFFSFLFFPALGTRAQLKREEARKGPSIIIKNRESVSPPLPG